MSRAPFLRTQKAGGVYIKPRVLSSFLPVRSACPTPLFIQGGSVPCRSLSDKKELFIKKVLPREKVKSGAESAAFPAVKIEN